MIEIVWTPQAQTDLEEISDYIAIENVSAALKLVEEVERKVGRLEHYPESARRVPELSGALHIYREIIVRIRAEINLQNSRSDLSQI